METIKLIDIEEKSWSWEEIPGFKSISREVEYHDTEKGYVEYNVVVQRESDRKYFKFNYQDWGRGDTTLKEATLEETFIPIPLAVDLDASYFPQDVETWCTDKDISTHYQDDGFSLNWDKKTDNPMKLWLLKTYGDDITKYTRFAVRAT